MEDDILVGNTPHGRNVIAARDKPTPQMEVGGVPFQEFNEGLKRGTRTLDDPDPGIDHIRFDDEEDEKIISFWDSPLGQLKARAESLVSDDAYSLSVLNNDPEGYQQRKQENLESLNTHDAALSVVRAALVEQGLMENNRLAPENFDHLPLEQQSEILVSEADRLNDRLVTPLDYMLLHYYKAGMTNVPYSDYLASARNIPLQEIKNLQANFVSKKRRLAEADLMEFVADQGFDGLADMSVDMFRQDFIPGFSWFTRLNIQSEMEDALGIESPELWETGTLLALGSRRERMREELIKMPPEELRMAVGKLKAKFNEWEKDPIKAVLMTRYGILEQFEAVFTEDVWDGITAEDDWDRWGGDLESMLEGVFTIAALGNGYKGLKRLFRSPTANVRARELAATAGESRVQATLDELMLQQDMALEFGLEADEAIPLMLPRPSNFIDEVDNLPDGTKNVIVRSERQRSKILEDTDPLQGHYLTPANKTNAVNRTIKELDLADETHVQGRMNVITPKANEAGFDMRVVVGESAEGGFESLPDAISETLRINDGYKEGNARIMRVNEQGVLEPVFSTPESLGRAATLDEVDTDTAARLLDGTADETYYVVYDREHYWNPIDKEAFGAEAIQSGTTFPRWVYAPNTQFGDEIYESFARSYRQNQVLQGRLTSMFDPYYKLGPDDKRFVQSTFEWMESYGKDYGRAPTLTETIAQIPTITEKQLNGVVAMKQGMDTMHDLFNRRLYRDWANQGFQTARPHAPGMATYHGKAMPLETVKQGEFMDPVTQEMKAMSKQDLASLYNRGGRIMELDMPIEVANTPKARATRIIVDDDAYEIGDLSTKPMVYHPGYSLRFYEDPYIIIKKTEGVKINGKNPGTAQSTVTEAIKMAGTDAEAAKWVARANRAVARRGRSGESFEYVRSNDLEQTESTLFVKQAIHREGRLFWDERNFDRLPDVNGNVAKLEDPVKSTERGIGIAARQLTHEDMYAALRRGFKESYSKILDEKELKLLDDLSLSELSNRLRSRMRNTPDKKLRAKIEEAKEIVDYFRLMQGTESNVIPFLREKSLNLATTINRITGKNYSWLENRAMQVDPFKAMRSVAFKVFMVFRPFRQALLQSSQIGFLAPLDPGYIFSGKVFKDALALRRGLAQYRNSAFDDGLSVAKFAKSMGLSEREYRLVLKEFDRSGLIDQVDVHAFGGGANKFHKTTLPAQGSTLGTIGYKARQGSTALTQWLQTIGFNFGEGNNVTFTYTLAMRRVMRNKKYNSPTELTRSDWNLVAKDATNLSLAMTKPNSFKYQQGALSVTTQFLGFSHKAALAMLAQNPAISKADAAKIVFGGFLLYGANQFGARDYTVQTLTSIGVEDRPLPGSENVTLVDLIAGGVIDTTFNYLADITIDDYKEIEFSFLAPGLDVFRLWEMQMRTVFEQPIGAAFGPFGGVASKILKSLEWSYWLSQGFPDMDPVDKFSLTANAVFAGTFPVYNDMMTAYMGYKMDQWYSASKEAMPLRPTMSALIARGLLGARTREELAYYALNSAVWEDKAAFDDTARANYKHMTRLISLWRGGVLDDEGFREQIGAWTNLFEDWPEGKRLEMMKASMVDTQNDSLNPSIFQQIIEAVEDKKIDPNKFLPLIDEFTDYSEKQREEIKSIIKEAHQGRIEVDKAALAELEDKE